MNIRKINFLLIIATFFMGIGSAQATHISQASQVTDIVTYNGNGTWNYQFTVFNNSLDPCGGECGGNEGAFVIVDWELPYFADANLSNISSPTGWGYAIETIGVANLSTGWDGVAAWQNPTDPWYQGPASPYTTGTEVLHWYIPTYIESVDLTYAIFAGSNLTGFGFDSSYGPTSSPYQASWHVLPIQTGDPAFPGAGIPNSPSVQSPSVVPEPSSIALLMIGALGLVAMRVRRLRQIREVNSEV